MVKNCKCAEDIFNLGLERAEREFVVCVHQDVYLRVVVAVRSRPMKVATNIRRRTVI
jgi:hypothetical protein